MENSEAIKSKIEKLFNKAESAKEMGSLQEAEIFMAKAQEILMKYNIEKGELNLGHEQGNPCVVTRVPVHERHGWTKTDGKWLGMMYNSIAMYNFCKVVFHGGGSHVSIIGEPANVEVVQVMADNIIPKVKSLRLGAWKEYHGHEKANAFKRGFYLGACTGIAAKLREEQEANKVKFEGLSGIVKLHDTLVTEKMADTFGKLRKARGGRSSSVSGFHKGHQSAKGIKVNKNISSGTAQKRLG